ncbi:MAG TPA: lysozyme inhibitor LprI family protein [Paenirhodobacter sp.]
MGTAVLIMAGLGAPVAQAADCASAQTQADLNICVGEDYQLADRTLNAVYARLMKRLDPRARGLLRDAQRAWIPFRDKHCAFVGSGTEGGSIQGMVIAGCLTELTTARAGQIIAQLSCAEGDVSCATAGN